MQLRTQRRSATLFNLLLASLVIWTIAPVPAFAHREDYLDETLVFVTLEQEEFEPEYWVDAVRNRETDKDFVRHNVAAEYGVTDHFMIDGRVTFSNETDDDTRFDSGRMEARMRFTEEGELPIDVAISGEVNVERDNSGDYKYGLEPRLILSKDFSDLNLTLNLPVEAPLNGGNAGSAPGLGARYDLSELFRVGSEVKYDIEDRSGAIIPQIWFAFADDLTLKLGYSQNFARNQERFFRVAMEAGF